MDGLTDGLVYLAGCRCAGVTCAGGHPVPAPYRGAAQHTYTPGCDGFHPAGRCPPAAAPPVTVRVPVRG